MHLSLSQEWSCLDSPAHPLPFWSDLQSYFYHFSRRLLTWLSGGWGRHYTVRDGEGGKVHKHGMHLGLSIPFLSGHLFYRLWSNSTYVAEEEEDHEIIQRPVSQKIKFEKKWNLEQRSFKTWDWTLNNVWALNNACCCPMRALVNIYFLFFWKPISGEEEIKDEATAVSIE